MGRAGIDGGEGDNEAVRWNQAKHVALRDHLREIQGVFVLTYDDSPFVRDLYANCSLVRVSQAKGINARGGRKRTALAQLIIASYDE